MSEFLQILENRADMYRFLSRFFIVEADRTFLEGLSKMTLPRDTGDERLERGYRAIEEWIDRNVTKAEDPDPVTTLAADYAHTFLGAGVSGAKAAYPFESVYTSPQGLVMQDAWEAVCAIYRENGFARPEGGDNHEDHVGLELDFMAHLCERDIGLARKDDEASARALAKDLAVQSSFVKTHLLDWISGFVRDVHRYSETTFYPGAADLLEGFLRLDAMMAAEFAEISARAVAAMDAEATDGAPQARRP